MDDNSQPTPPAPEPDPTGGSLPPSTPTAATAPAAPAWWSRWHRLVFAGIGSVVVLGVSAAALLFLLQPAASIERMVPATTDVYVLANLDPSVAQKVNLMQVVHRFPDASTDQKISDQLDKWLKDSGLSYSHDLQPWLGSGVALAVEIPSGKDHAPSAVFAISKDDAKAQAFLANLRTGKYTLNSNKAVLQTAGVHQYSVRDYTWQDKSYDGITISMGTPKSAGEDPIAYAIVDHVVVTTNSEAFLHEIIDTEHGHGARLVDTAQYKATLSKLPSDRIAVAYLNGKNLSSRLKNQLKTPAMSGLGSLSSLSDLDAFQGAALVLSARSDGIVGDVAVRIDSSKLSASTRQAMSNAGHPSTVISWVPASSDAFLAFGNLRQTIQSLLDQVGTDPSVQQSTDELGLTGPQGVLSHLTGDFAFEVEINRSFIPAGAVMIGTNSTPAMRSFFAGVLTLATAGSGVQVTPKNTTYRGVTVTTVTVPSWGPSSIFAPSYAAVDGMGVMASNVAELRAIIDAHKGNSGIDHDASYEAAIHASLPNPGSVFYVAVDRLVSTVQSAPSSSPVVTLKNNANLTPLHAFIVTSSSSQDGILERIILFIE